MAEITKLVPRIPFAVRRRHRNWSNPAGPLGRVDRIRKILSQLFKYERIELNLPICDEARGYAERLICEAIRNGDKHPPTMDMAAFWLFIFEHPVAEIYYAFCDKLHQHQNLSAGIDKQMVHKLFKVLAPRYENYKTSVTDMHLIPIKCELAMKPHAFRQLCVLELKGNPYPPMPPKPKPNSASLTNILLKEASKEFRKMKLNSEAASNKD